MKLFKLTIYTILIVIILITGYIIYISNFTINVNEYNLKYVTKKSNLYGLKIVYIADTLYSDRTNKQDLNQLVKLVNKSKPNIIIFNGDLIKDDIKQDNQNNIITAFKKLKADTHKLAVVGDDKEISQNILSNAGFKVLNNELINVYYKGNEAISVYGYNDKIDQTMLKGHTEHIFIISDKQTNFNNFIKYKPKLILSANMHQFNINIPFANLYQTDVPDYVSGYTKLKNTDVYLSNGIGTKYNFRFNSTPEIYLFRLIN